VVNSGEVAAQVLHHGDASVTSGADGELDGDQCDAGKTRAWTASSFASSSEAERRLEDARAPVTFGLHWRAQFYVKRFNPRASRGAPEQRKKNRLGEEALGSPLTSESSGKPADLRISVDEFCRLRFVPSGETKGRE
jgi:hypothetical protein